MSLYNIDENKNMVPFAGANRCLGTIPIHRDSNDNIKITRDMVSLYDWFILYSVDDFPSSISNITSLRRNISCTVPVLWSVSKFPGSISYTLPQSLTHNLTDYYYRDAYFEDDSATSGEYYLRIHDSVFYTGEGWEYAKECRWIIMAIEIG